MMNYQQMYEDALKDIRTRLEILCSEFQIDNQIDSRIKTPGSIYLKMIKYGIIPSLDSALEHIHDIAGIRVVCCNQRDIYSLEKLLLDHDDLILITRKDYIEHPKKSGYRSLHIIVKVPVTCDGAVFEIPVEIQLRTKVMDYWASLEHKLQYKNNGINNRYSVLLFDCANKLAETEREMETLYEKIGA